MFTLQQSSRNAGLPKARRSSREPNTRMSTQIHCTLKAPCSSQYVKSHFLSNNPKYGLFFLSCQFQRNPELLLGPWSFPWFSLGLSPWHHVATYICDLSYIKIVVFCNFLFTLSKKAYLNICLWVVRSVEIISIKVFHKFQGSRQTKVMIFSVTGQQKICFPNLKILQKSV